MANKNYQTINERQSYVQKSGEEWENKVMDFVNERLKSIGSDLLIIKGRGSYIAGLMEIG